MTHAVPDLFVDTFTPLEEPARDGAGDHQAPSVPGVSNDLRLCGGCGDAGAGSHVAAPDRRLGRYEEEADLIFWADAWKLGYLKQDAHAPGNGRGFWAYYRDHGIIPPEVLERNQSKSKPLTGRDFDSARHAVEQDGTTPIANTGRLLPHRPTEMPPVQEFQRVAGHRWSAAKWLDGAS